MKNLLVLIFCISSIFGLRAQEIDFEKFEDLKFRNIGPAGMSGRITAIDVDLRDKDHIYVGSASGGLWESKNGGISWKPIFDEQPCLSIGAIKINQQNPDEIWVGTGEGNPRNSHNSGAGIFRSIDGGKTWSYKGLKNTKLIHRIIINQLNPKEVIVGALGSAWNASPDRGVFKTSNGGESWEKVLYVNATTGVGEMVVDPSNPNKILVAMWEFNRTPWGFNSGGEGSGLYLTYDGGTSWKQLTDKEGLPKGILGRMGLAFAKSKPNIVYALIEAKDNALYMSTDGGEKWSLVSRKDVGNRPFYYAEIYVDPLNENRIYNLWSYVSKSEDGGKTFETIMDYGNSIHPDHHAFWIDPEDSNYLIDGNDGGLNISRDGAQSWQFVQNLPVGQFYHVSIDDDFPYNVYGGMQDNGSWVGPGFVLKSGGIRNADWQELYFGDGFDVVPRTDDNRYGYGMSQGGNIAHWDKRTGRTEFIKPQHPEGEKLRFNWNAALALDPNNECGLYFGSQYVHYSTDCGHSWRIISPDLTSNDSLKQDQSKSGGLTLDVTGAENHTTLLCIEPSTHDKDIIWTGSDDGRVYRSADGGISWTRIDGRMPGFPKDAWVPQIEVSKINPSEVFVVVNNYRLGDWSAYLYHSLDHGTTWQRIVSDNQVEGFVCSVLQDPEHEDLIFLGTDVGLYFSLDHGKRWIKWTKSLPPVQIRDMKINKDFDDLILGTFGRSFWILDDIKVLRELSKESLALLDREFKVFEGGVHYLTSRRSYDGIRFLAQADFIGDNKSSAAEFTIWRKPKKEKPTPEEQKPSTAKDKKSDTKKEKPKSKKGESEDDKKEQESDDSDQGSSDDGESDEENPDKKSKGKKDSDVHIIAISATGDTVRTFKRKLKEGMNRISWNPSTKGVDFPRRNTPKEISEPGGMPILPGRYKMVFTFQDIKDSTYLEIALDPRIDEKLSDPEEKFKAMASFNKVIEASTNAFDNLKEASKSMKIYKEIIDVQPDSISKGLLKLHKKTSSQIDSLMNLYMLPSSDKPEYKDDSETLTSYLRNARNFLNTSLKGPTSNGNRAIEKAKKEARRVVESINDFFDSDWQAYVQQIKALPLDIYKSYDAVKIE